MLFPIVSDEQLELIRCDEPTAFRVSFPLFGDLIFRKPKRIEVKRLQDAVRKGGDPEFLVGACLLSPSLPDWQAAIEQEASGLPATALDAICKAVGIAAEYDLGK